MMRGISTYTPSIPSDCAISAGTIQHSSSSTASSVSRHAAHRRPLSQQELVQRVLAGPTRRGEASSIGDESGGATSDTRTRTTPTSIPGGPAQQNATSLF
eukprot:scaffold2584_cov113-Isochrysis_galbana.AAC.8